MSEKCARKYWGCKTTGEHGCGLSECIDKAKSDSTVLLCSCGNKAIGTYKNKPFCRDCVKAATPKAIMARLPAIKDKKFIDYLKKIGRE